MSENKNLHTLHDQRLKPGNRIAFLVIESPRGNVLIKDKKWWRDPHADSRPSLRKIVMPDGQQLKYRPGTVLAGTVVSVSNGQKTKKRKPIYLHEVNVTVKDIRVENSATEAFTYYLHGDSVIEIQEIFVGDIRLGRLCWSLRPGKASRGIPLHLLRSMSKVEYGDLGRKIDWKRRRRDIDDAAATRLLAYLADRNTMTQAST